MSAGAGQRPPRPGALQRNSDEHVLRRLVGDRERLDAELLLGLQRGEPGRGLLHVGVDQRADAGLQRIRLLAEEGVLRLDPRLRGTEGSSGGVGAVDQGVNRVEVGRRVVGQRERGAKDLEIRGGNDRPGPRSGRRRCRG